jgi:uncharacterized membrane protein
MHRLLEILLGLNKGFLSRDGELQWHFSPIWPKTALLNLGALNWVLAVAAILLAVRLLIPFKTRTLISKTKTILWSTVWIVLAIIASGNAAWNAILIAAAACIVAFVYRREGHSLVGRLAIGGLRMSLLLFIVAMLNRPVVTLVESLSEPSVLAIAIDDTASMQVKDAAGPNDKPQPRLAAIEQLLTQSDASLLNDLAKTHILKFYHFAAASDQTAAEPIASIEGTTGMQNAVQNITALQPIGRSTQVISTVRSILENLQGQRVAGIVLLTDGRDNPIENMSTALNAVKNFGVRVYPVVVGSDRAPRSFAVQAIRVQDTAFKGDIVNVKATVRASGYPAGHIEHLTLIDTKRNGPLLDSEGQPVTRDVTIDNDKPQEVELLFKADKIGPLEVTVKNAGPGSEIPQADPPREPVDVLDAKINVFYAEGYPRWEYRYIKNEMIREPTVNLSCYLQSADTGFVQEHSKPDETQNLKYFPFREFPTSIEQLQECDVVLFGDVDVQRLSDAQLQIVRQFVEQFGGGFGMIAGERWSPQAYRNTPLQDLLPVNITDVQTDDTQTITQGFRPTITSDGEASSIFRFFPSLQINRQYLADRIQPIFWYCHGVVPKPAVAQVLAEHPTDTLPNGQKAPLLVVGHYGSGNTLFSAIDESWRWRFYTGESIFNTYWVQQLRYLARAKKIGSREMTFASPRYTYEIGEQVQLSLHILNRKLLQQLPEQLGVEILDANGNVIRRENLVRQQNQNDTYLAQFTADRTGALEARLPPITAQAKALNVRIAITAPQRELDEPQADRRLLSRLASVTGAVLPGQKEPKLIELAAARADMLAIPSAAQSIPRFSDAALWDAPLAMLIFMLLISTEWILRKMFGML